MKLSRKTGLLATAALMTQIATAQALDFHWSWHSLGASGPFPSGTVVSGTISGLLDNTAGQGLADELTVAVNQPVGPVTGFQFTASSRPSPQAGFAVVNGAVTFADIFYTSTTPDGTYRLWFGTNPGISTFSPEFAFSPGNIGQGTLVAALPPQAFDLASEGATTFTPTNNAAPEPASMALLGAGLAGLGFARRRRS